MNEASDKMLPSQAAGMASTTPTAGAGLLWKAWRILQPFVVLVIVAGIFFVYGLIFKSDSPFLSSYRLTLIAKQTAIVGMGALGMTVIIISGGIDLSVGSILALAAVSLAALLREEVNPLLATLVVLAAGIAAGTLNGVIITGLRLGAVYRHAGDDACVPRAGGADRTPRQDCAR